jgi:hypothetical protein
MSEDSFSWPEDADECDSLARSMFVSECASHARYWLDWGAHFLKYPQPETPFVRSWSAVAKEDRAFREVFATLTEQQRVKIIELLQRCVRGTVFSTLCTLDQFPHGEAEISVREGVGGDGPRSFRIAPSKTELHDDFTAALAAPLSTDNGADA